MTLLDHTADIGLRVCASGPVELFERAALACCRLVCDPATVRVAGAVPLQAGADDRAALLVRWLNRLLVERETRSWVFARVAVHDWSETGVRGEAFGEPYDPARHTLETEIKAVTYHGLLVGPAATGGWEAQFIVDV